MDIRYIIPVALFQQIRIEWIYSILFRAVHKQRQFIFVKTLNPAPHQRYFNITFADTPPLFFLYHPFYTTLIFLTLCRMLNAVPKNHMALPPFVTPSFF